MAALLVTAAASASANVLVVRSSGPSAASYPAGRSLADNAQIALRAGDTLVILDARGTRTFRGPGNFTPATLAQAGQRTTSGANGRIARIGAVRSAGILPVSPSTIWQVDASQSATICLANASDVTLWRPESSETTSLSIAGPGGARTVAWPAGETTLAWPTDLPIRAGVAYELSRPDVAVPTRITFRQLNSSPDDMQGVAAALIENGCQEQLDLLVDSAPTIAAATQQ